MKKRKALILKLAAKNERQWQVIEPAALPPTRLNLERNTEEVPETNKTYMQLETENHVSPSADAGCEVTVSTNADLTIIDPVEVPVGLMDVKAWVNKLPSPLLPTLFIDTESPTKTSKTDLTELQPLSKDESSESDSECSDEPATGIEIENANSPTTRRRKRGKLTKEL